MARSNWVPSHLFLAVPEVFMNMKTLRKIRDYGLINDETYDSLRRSNRSLRRMFGEYKGAKNLLQRILAINPDQLDEDFVALLRLGGLISKTQAHQMRLMARSNNALHGRRTDRTILTRYKRLFGVAYSEESVSLMRSLKMINVNQADFWRATILTSKVTAETLPQMIRAKNFADMLALAGDGIIDPRMVRAMMYSGMINKVSADRLSAAILMAKADWRNFTDAKRTESFMQRLAYTAAGSFNHETLTFLRAMGFISRKQELFFRIPVQIGLDYQRTLQERWTKRKYRPRSNEVPIKTFARASKKTEADLLHLLADAAKDAQKTALKLDAKKGIGATARSAQYKNVTRELHTQMQALWEGNGYLTIFGQHEAAQAALEANENLMKKLTGRLPKETQFMLSYNARSNVDAYISRQENLRSLSRSVYKNVDLYSGKVNKMINLGLLQGKSAREIAADVSGFIKPNVRGGVSYAAMRLARTELQNAFHFTAIRYGREQPWVEGMKWHLSGSHTPSGDACEQYANDDHGMDEPGVFKKSEVPGKPHPNCFCYITQVTVDEDIFFARYAAGYYNRYLKENAEMTPDGENSFLHDGIQNVFTRVGG